ncbi:MAG: arylsulfatase [Verrucomicrobiota bacterium]
MIFILADDMGYGDVSHAGGLAATPHIDRLAKEGMRFTDAHTTSAVCTPTRYGILTGRYNWRSKLKKSVLWGMSEPLINEERVTVPDFLKDHGYQTGIVGKWHLGLGWQFLPNGEKRKAVNGETKGKGWEIDYEKRVTSGPNEQGFEKSFIIPASLDMEPYVYLRDGTPTAIATHTKGFLKPFRPGPAAEDFDAMYCLIDFAREARAFIKESAKNEEKPFFLYLPLTSPHTPIIPSENWQGKSELGPYGDFVMETDWVVGEVLAELEAQGVDENTLVLFTADNGCSPMAEIPELKEMGHKVNADWRGHKADIYEGGHRVPFLVRWPAVVGAGKTTDATVCTSDFFATAAALIGKSDAVPENAAEDSFPFDKVLRGNVDDQVRPFTIHHSINGSFAIRKGKWKLCLCPGSGGWSEPKPNKALKDESLSVVQLFDLESDPAETKNVEAEHPELIGQLVNDLAMAIRNGRTNVGPNQSNEGWPNTFPQKVLDRFPILSGE